MKIFTKKKKVTTIEETKFVAEPPLNEKTGIGSVAPKNIGKLDMVIAFDTTGSMAEYIGEVRKQVSTLIPELFRDNEDLRLGIVAFGDYCDMKNAQEFGKAYQSVPLSNDVNGLIKFVMESENTGGGDWPEFYELVIKKIVEETKWREESTRTILLIADAVPHESGYSYHDYVVNNKIDWREEAMKAADMKIKIDTVSISGEPWFKELSKMTNGICVPFRSGGKTVEMVEAAVWARGSEIQRKKFDAKFDACNDLEMKEVYMSYRDERLKVDGKDSYDKVSGKIPVKNLDAAKLVVTGVICGDTIGSFYEFNATKDYDFQLFHPRSKFTDDTVCTIALADTLANGIPYKQSLLAWCRRFPGEGYGGRFRRWIHAADPEPYNSWGNGSAMRVAPVGAFASSEEEALRLAKESAEITHNHPEGIKGAQATALAIFLALTGKSKEEIKSAIESRFGYNLSRRYDEIKPMYGFTERCEFTVPEAIISFLESTDYESAVRKAVALGGDADTLAAITGGIAAAFYGEIPKHIAAESLSRLPYSMKEVLHQFNSLLTKD